MTFPDKVKKVRIKLYLTQAQLAKELGVSFATINRWENGHGEPNLLINAKFEEFANKHGIKFE
ncbi:MAG: helix-turn-helix transcriptional regulator, partial [Clostridia bacterium]